MRKLVSCVFLLAALVAAPAALTSAAPGAPASGKEIFFSRHCDSCHQVRGPATDKTIEDRLARKGPELWYAGSKFKPGFLEAWLAKPVPIRPLEYNSLTRKNAGEHMRLTPVQARHVAAYLMGLTSGVVKKGVIRPGLDRRGRVFFIKRMACYGCHRVKSRGRLVGGLSAPALAGAASRLNPDWIYAYLSNPDVFKPVRAMPNYVGIMSDNEMRSLAAYAATL